MKAPTTYASIPITTFAARSTATSIGATIELPAAITTTVCDTHRHTHRSTQPFARRRCDTSTTPTARASEQQCIELGGLAGKQPGQTVARPGQLAVAVATLRSGHAGDWAASGSGEHTSNCTAKARNQYTYQQLNQTTDIATEAQYDRAGNALQMADAEIARFRAILQQIDELENEFEKIKRIRDIVRSWRARVEQMERRLG